VKNFYMPENYPSIINIALVGGDSYCKDFLEKTLRDYSKKEVNARFVAIADTNLQSPGVLSSHTKLILYFFPKFIITSST